MRRIAVWGAVIALWPVVVLGCALPPSIVMTLPVGWYLWGAGLTIALTGALGALAKRLPLPSARVICKVPRFVPADLGSYLGCLGFWGLIGLGLWGPRDPYHNLWTLIFWVGVWVALPLASMLLGNLWGAVAPWRALVRALRTLLGWQGKAGLGRFGHWPAVLGLAGFSWFQIVSLSPEDPYVLAQVAMGYYLVILILAVAEGEDWLEQGEFLTLYFAYLSRIAPLWRKAEGRHIKVFIGWPGTQIAQSPKLSPSQIAFITLALASLSFDGLRDTFWWLDLIGQNPLEFAGRSAVMIENSLGLLAAWVLTLGAILGGIAMTRGALEVGPMMLSFLAIAAGYHLAHYLMTLLTAGQYLVAALNDPFLQGQSWLGLPPFWISMGFLTDRSTMTLIWNTQFLAILGAHLLAMLLVMQLSNRQSYGHGHLPLTALMVGYTVFGLWMLSSPTGS